MARLLASYDHRFALNGLDGMIVLSLLGLSALLGWLGAGFAASRHLAQGPST
jgi:cell division transport system permease protein